MTAWDLSHGAQRCRRIARLDETLGLRRLLFYLHMEPKDDYIEIFVGNQAATIISQHSCVSWED